MASEGSVTHWIQLMPDGGQQAVQQLWEKYFKRLVGLVRAKLQNFPRQIADEEDLALSAFDSFCRGLEQGRFPQMADRTNLWSLLVTITARKVLNLKRDQQRLKRGGGNTSDGLDDAIELENVLGEEPSPDFAAEVAEECQRLLDLLGDEDLRRVTLWKMEGFTNKEIAQKLPCSPRTVERKLDLIRGIWEKKGVV
ncbi:MAG: ECF-type sigma factor [Gemmataceae bacterium]